MFEWLTNEMAQIKTNKFHLVDGPPDANLRTAIEESSLPVPGSYKAFVFKFGNAKLYRKGGLYVVEVFAGPRSLQLDTGEAVLQFGRAGYLDKSLAYFKKSAPSGLDDYPVFEWTHELGLKTFHDNFEQWLIKQCKKARGLFKKEEWAEIRKGPEPFSDQERQIIEARKKFKWRVVGVSENMDIKFEVHNGSDIVLPYLSVGIRGKKSEFSGGVWLPISSIPPGETRVIEKDCYKKHISPDEVEAFEKPDPGPEDRDRYWEFKKTGSENEPTSQP